MENENSFLSVLLTVSVFVISIGCRNGGKDNSTAPIDTNQTFGIYMSQLDGGKFSPIILDHTREMNHARVSPDKTKITFTRFNRDSNNNGLSEENDGYYKTEVMIANLDGSELESLIPPSEDHINCNSYWTPDGSGMIYMSNDNESLLDILVTSQ